MVRDININVSVRQAGADLDLKITSQGKVLSEVHKDRGFTPLSLGELGQEIMRTFWISLLKEIDAIKIKEVR